MDVVIRDMPDERWACGPTLKPAILGTGATREWAIKPAFSPGLPYFWSLPDHCLIF